MSTNNSINTGMPIPVANGGTGQTTAVGAFDSLSPTTTKGDVIVSNGADNIRLAVGTNGQVIMADSGEVSGIKWATPAAGTVTSVSGTADRITSSGGATPVIDIAATYVGQASITTLGSIATGTWNATTIAINHGGTGQVTANAAFNALSPLTTKGDLIAYDVAANVRVPAGADGTVLSADAASTGGVKWIAVGGAGTVTNVTGTANRITVATGTTTPVIDISASYVGQASITTLGTIATGVWNSTPVTVTYGGTGLATMTTPYAVVCAGTTATGNLQPLAALGASGTVLTSNGAAALPSFQAAARGDWVKISSATAASSATISFTGLTATYRAYVVVISNLVAASVSHLLMRTSTNAGVSYDSAAANYTWHAAGAVDNSNASSATTTDTSINLTAISASYTIGTSTTATLNGMVNIFNNNIAAYCLVKNIMAYTSAGSGVYSIEVQGSGYRSSATAVNAIQFLMSSGNIASGIFELYGIVA